MVLFNQREMEGTPTMQVGRIRTLSGLALGISLSALALAGVAEPSPNRRPKLAWPRAGACLRSRARL